MPSLFSGINIALRSLLTQQQAMQITEHNVANANTEGYRRQEAVLTTTPPYSSATLYGNIIAGDMGTGVQVDRIRQFNLEFFDGRYRKELAESSRWSTQESVLKQVEATLSETGDDGILNKLNEFWASLQALGNDPSTSALRSDLKEKAQSLADALNWRVNALQNIRKDQDSTIVERVNEINTSASQIAALNSEISQAKAAGDSPNDLIDKRDALLNRLAEISGATSSTQDNGEAIVSIGGHALVVGNTTFELATSPDATNSNLTQITWKADGQAFDTSRGELAGLFSARDTTIPDQMDGLKELAQNLATQVNTQHRLGYGLNDNVNGRNFFSFTVTGNIFNLSLSADISDPNNIAASTLAGSAGDGNNAVAIANIQNKLVMNTNTSTFNQFYTNQITQLGLDVQDAATKSSDRDEVVQSLKAMSESVSGVSLDEEAANMVKTQRAYEAAARMMTTLDSMLNTLINGMGVVGR